ncbi:unnamed protein product [Arabidopsis thaliana]|uniref:AT3G15770 protein n=2 Tax=Arabidopsis thaliana TaxID=3702 RepID=B9DGF6_ARATH|nr:uncharacterized protein AT3G15770 [Arabidopsis thaliana]AEE75724.1 hypothetical protein AT3G15770 [Arabidopsis thaliana]BAH19823.1 AT3G15770 [Arabidopsis thaliana]CAD5323196.1 unnamed protein product [Arabidopsis thaliana]VYS57511.1 unnamed protein product [Arabidopsis thaliana]|eukprot:NP_188198.3 hypothetical protein AT3G15770 [Arabidopsis thaliana]
MGSSCLACFDKSKAKTSVDVPLNGTKDVLVEEDWSELRKPSVVASEDFWTNTTLDMESNAHGSVSSISTTNLTIDSQGCGSSSNEPAEFVNHGLVLWNQTRQQWVGDKRSESRKSVGREPILNENVTYESLLGSNKRFPRPIPLDEMVQFLVEVWEEEGLYG